VTGLVCVSNADATARTLGWMDKVHRMWTELYERSFSLKLKGRVEEWTSATIGVGSGGGGLVLFPFGSLPPENFSVAI